MIPKRRREETYKYINTHGTVTLKEISEKFNITIFTVRRDFNLLIEEGLIEKVYGGASIKKEIRTENGVAERIRINIDEKTRIAQEALKRIFTGANIFIEAGSTGLALVSAIRGKNGINIITISPHIANAVAGLKRDNDFSGTLYCTGGIWMKDPDDIYYGPHALSYFNNINIDIAFIGSVALDLKNGLMVPSTGELELLKKVISVSNKVIGIVDSTKFGKRSLNNVGLLSLFDEIITDKNLGEEEAKKYLSETKITLV